MVKKGACLELTGIHFYTAHFTYIKMDIVSNIMLLTHVLGVTVLHALKISG